MSEQCDCCRKAVYSVVVYTGTLRKEDEIVLCAGCRDWLLIDLIEGSSREDLEQRFERRRRHKEPGDRS